MGKGCKKLAHIAANDATDWTDCLVFGTVYIRRRKISAGQGFYASVTTGIYIGRLRTQLV